jgi:anaerobic selenocysteine-containing dehydrogenase
MENGGIVMAEDKKMISEYIVDALPEGWHLWYFDITKDALFVDVRSIPERVEAYLCIGLNPLQQAPELIEKEIELAIDSARRQYGKDEPQDE